MMTKCEWCDDKATIKHSWPDDKDKTPRSVILCLEHAKDRWEWLCKHATGTQMYQGIIIEEVSQ
jgi:hypothetical protein